MRLLWLLIGLIDSTERIAGSLMRGVEGVFLLLFIIPQHHTFAIVLVETGGS